MLLHLLLGAALAVGQADTPPPNPPDKVPVEEAPFPEEKPVIETVEEEILEEVTSPDRWLLMRSLQGTWLGMAMDCSRVSLYGWAAGSFTPSTATHNNFPVVWNDLANEFLLQQAWVRLERTIVTDTTTPTWGFRSDWLFGTDYRFTLPRGIFNGQLENDNGLPNLYGVDPIAFYLEGYIPTCCHGLDMKVGRWFTPFGVESLEAISTPLVSRSYSFNFAPPFTHTGALFTLNINPTWTLQMGPCVGNDIFLDAPANEPRMVSTLRWAPPGGRDTVTFGTSIGHGTYDLAQDFNRINVFDIVWTHTFTSRVSYAFECIYGYQNQFPVTNDEDEVEDFIFTNWAGWVNYLFWTLNPKCTSVTRLEFFDDFQGVRTGFEGLYTAITTGLQYRPNKHVLILPELRYDYNSESRPFEDKHGIFTAGCEVLFRW
jgi:hypothetical protein